MSQFWLYFRLGLDHVLDWSAYDHILFLIVLVVGLSFANWKKIILLVSLFTIGHTLALFLSVYEIVQVASNWIELLIPFTILITALYNILTSKRKFKDSHFSVLYFTTVFFGLIHGLGFSTYFKMIATTSQNQFWPLIEFALGIEVAQIIVVITVVVLGFIFQNILRVAKRDWVIIISSIVVGIILPILRENWLAL